MEAALPLPELEDWERGKPLPRMFGIELPWWLALLVFGDSAPMEERTIRQAKRDWNTLDEDQQKDAKKGIQDRFNELDASTLNNFVRLTIVAGVIAGLIGLGQVVAPLINGAKTPAPSIAAAWLYMGFLAISIVCALIMVVPKFKEFRKFKPATRDNVGAEVLKDVRESGWPEFVRLMHRYAHRIQLITFERRVKHISCASAALAFVAYGAALFYA